MKHIYCDEAGYTGSNLLDINQPYFVFASVSVSPLKANEILEVGRTLYKIRMNEFKATELLRKPTGRRFIDYVVAQISEHYHVSLYDKKFALCAWFYEYFMEPVFDSKPTLKNNLYKLGFHRYIARLLYADMQASVMSDLGAYREIQSYLRNFDSESLSFLFAEDQSSNSDIVNTFCRFSHLYKDILLQDHHLMKAAKGEKIKFLMDLSATSLWSHIQYWGGGNDELTVFCDKSKPLEAFKLNVTSHEDDYSVSYLQSIFGDSVDSRYKLSEQISFKDSQQCTELQLADILASTYRWLLTKQCPDDFVTCKARLFDETTIDGVLPVEDYLGVSAGKLDIFNSIFRILSDRTDSLENNLSLADGYVKLLVKDSCITELFKPHMPKYSG